MTCGGLSMRALKRIRDTRAQLRGEVEFIYLFVYLDNLLLQFAKDITRITANNRAVPNADTGGTKDEPSRAATQGIFGGS